MISCVSHFIEISKDDQNLKFLDEYILKSTNKITLNSNETLIDQVKIINSEGYKLLKIKDPLDFDTLKKLYVAAAKEYHPDLGGDTRKMQIVNESYAQFHELITLSIDFKEGSERIKSSMDYVYYAYIDLINILIDSWNVDGAYKYLKEAIDRSIFSSKPKDLYNFFECSTCFNVCKRLPNIGFNNEGLEILNYAETFVNNIKGRNMDYYTNEINTLRGSLNSNKKYRVTLSHKTQTENAKRLGIITDSKYNEYITKFNIIEINEKQLSNELENSLLSISFIVPLIYEKKLFGKLTKPKTEKLVPETNYFECNIYEITKAQQQEYFKAFSEKTDLKLIRKYVFVRLYSFINSVYGDFSKELCIDVVKELMLIIKLYKENQSVQSYSNKILESFNILLNLDDIELNKRIMLIKKYCTRGSKILHTPITIGFMEFITLNADEIEKVVNKNMPYNLITHYDKMERTKLDEEFLNPLKKDEDNAWLALRTLKKTDLNKAGSYIEIFVAKGLEVLEKLHAPEWFEITFWLEELCKVNTRLGRNESSKFYLEIFFELPDNRRGRTGPYIIKRLEERLLKLKEKL